MVFQAPHDDTASLVPTFAVEALILLCNMVIQMPKIYIYINQCRIFNDVHCVNNPILLQ
jgi:hypothetical protein